MKIRSRHAKKKGSVSIDINNRESMLHLYPKFSLEHLRGKYCLSHCTKDEKSALIDTIHNLSKVTWNAIINAPRHGLGFEKITFSQTNGIDEKFKEEKIVAFRFCGKAPMIGYREKEVFYVLALDRDFTCYTH